MNDFDIKYTKEILIIDDSKVFGRILKSFLDKWEYESRIITDGNEAWEVLKQNNHEIILLDRHLPGLDGTEIANNIKNNLKDNYIYNHADLNG